MLQSIIHKSQTMNRVAIPYGMLDDITAALNASGIGITNILDRPYIQLQPDERTAVMADLDAADVGGRRLVIEAAGDIDDMHAFVRDRLSAADRSESMVIASNPCDKAHASNTSYSELIDCYRDSVARGNAETAAEEREMLRDMWVNHERTLSAAIAYAHKTDDVASELAFTSLLEDTKRCLLEDGIIGSSL